MHSRTMLATLIARMEGFGKPGAIPTVRHNPGDLRHGPHAHHPGDPNAVGTYDSDAEGWDDLERQLGLYAARGMTLREMVAIYAPPSENDTLNYLNFICDALGLAAETPVSVALKIPAASGGNPGEAA